jgi:predicted secreted hydrolase
MLAESPVASRERGGTAVASLPRPRARFAIWRMGVLAVCGLALASGVAGCGGSAGNRVAAKTTGSAAANTTGGVSAAGGPALTPVVLPRDHGSHPAVGIEWWYTTGWLTDAQGGRYFYFATVWSAAMGLVARINVVDLRHDRVVADREYIDPTRLRGHTTTIRAGSYVLTWHSRGRGGVWSIAAPATGGLTSLPAGAPRPQGALSLRLVPEQPYVLHGSQGIIRQGPAPSAYYSAPRLAVTGTLLAEGRRLAVHGQGWFDHQWGNFPTEQSSLRWNWFACQLSDGRALMLYEFLTAGDVPSGIQSGTLVTRDGQGSHLQQFTITPHGPFLRPAGAQASYPQAWTLTVPSAHLELSLRSLAANQFISMEFVPGFWEGAAAITHGPPGRCVVESTREPTAGEP